MTDVVVVASPFAVTLAVGSYALCSGSLLLVNKVVLLAIPAAPLVTAIQCATCLVAILASALAFGTPSLGVITRGALQAYAAYGALFVVAIYANMKALEHSNVDTIIAFRSTTPLLVAAGDWVFMGRSLPPARSLLAMAVIVVGCVSFVSVDAAFDVSGVRAYAWVSVYIVVLAVEMLLGKAIISEHTDVSLAGSVVLTNAIALVPFLAIGTATGELARGLNPALYTTSAVSVLALSCALSGGIGFSSWWARSLVSATTFTVVGVACKIFTVLLNIMFWSRHASPLGTAFLLLCLGGGAAYQQAPMRTAVATAGGSGVEASDCTKISSSAEPDLEGEGVLTAGGVEEPALDGSSSSSSSSAPPPPDASVDCGESASLLPPCGGRRPLPRR